MGENLSPQNSFDGGPEGKSPSSGEEALDPRIQLELEKLNSSTDQINKLEKELEETNEQFRVLLSNSAEVLEKMTARIGKGSIERARPYFCVAKSEADDLQKKCLEAAAQFHRANDVHREAKKAVQQAEGRYNVKDKESHFDGGCQEVLNRLTMQASQVMEAERQKRESESRHRVLSEKFFAAERKVQELEKLLQKDIVKSKSYFDMKNGLNDALNELKTKTMQLRSSILNEKRAYSRALNSLEMISEEIHRTRRTPGEGAEEDRKEVDE